MKADDIKEFKPPKAEVERLRRMKIDYSDIPPLTDEQLARMVRLREYRKRIPISVRIDPRVMEWLRSKGPGHLTRINDILVNLMEAERRNSGKA